MLLQMVIFIFMAKTPWCVYVWAACIFWILTPYQPYHLEIFSPIPSVLYVLLLVSFVVPKLSHLILFCLFLMLCFFIPGKINLNKKSCYEFGQNVFPIFTSRSFLVSYLIFRSPQYFELIFGYGVRECSNFNDLHIRQHLHVEPEKY